MRVLQPKANILKIYTLLLLLVPSLGRADMGSAGSLVLLLGIGVAIWFAFILFIFFALRKNLSTGKRLAIASALFFLPYATILFDALQDAMLGKTPHQVIEITQAPMSVYGVAFPEGSRATYQESGGFFGKGAIRQLQEIHSPSTGTSLFVNSGS